MTDEQMSQVTDKLGQVTDQISQLSTQMNDRFEAVDQRFTGVETRLDRIEVRLEKHDEDIKLLAEQILIGQKVTNLKIDGLQESIVQRLEPLEVVVREHFKGTTPQPPQ